jgi:hypothetical protein
MGCGLNSSERSKYVSGFHKRCRFSDDLNDYQLLKKDSTLCSLVKQLYVSHTECSASIKRFLMTSVECS